MATIQGVYLALFGRPADPTGLAFFNNVTSNGQNLSAIGNLASTAEYQTRFQGFAPEQVINSIYQSLFGRDAEPTGLAFHLAELTSGRQNINSIAISIMDGAQGADATIIANKLVASATFTSHIDTAAERMDYSGTFAAETGRDFLDGITADASTIPNGELADLQLLFLQGRGTPAAPFEVSDHSEQVSVVGVVHDFDSFA